MKSLYIVYDGPQQIRSAAEIASLSHSIYVESESANHALRLGAEALEAMHGPLMTDTFIVTRLCACDDIRR